MGGISVQFNGASINVPGAYSRLKVKQAGGLPLSETGIVGIIGESTGGAPGSVSGVVEYTSATLINLVDQYKSGPIVDAAKVLINCSNDQRVAQGANKILVYKTNPSTQSTLALASGWGTLTSQNYGRLENLISAQIDEDTAEAWLLQFGADWTTTPGNDITLRVNGGTVVTITGANCTSAANTVTELNSKLNTALGTVGINYASTVVNRISINLAITGTGAKRSGMGIVLEFIANSEWADVGVTVPQQGVALAAGVAGAVSLTAANPKRSITVDRQADGITEQTSNTTGEVGGVVYMEIGCNAATSCTIVINATQLILDATGAGASDVTVNLADFATLNDLASFLNAQTGYFCSIPSNVNGALPPSVLDRVTTTGICASTASLKPGKIKADAYSVRQWFNLNSTLVTATSTSFSGLPNVTPKTFLSGAVLGASTTSLFDAGFTAFEGKRVNIVIPLVSQDASDDLVESATYTDPSSSYDVESIHAQARAHCKKMSSTINRSERNFYVGIRGTFAEAKAQSYALATEFGSLLFQDVQVVDVDGILNWKQPHIHACVIAGMQAGAEIGEPITHKYIAVNGIRHRKKQGATPSSTESFDANNVGHKQQAIDASLAISEAPSSGGIRLVLHNTTYNRDSSFVFNRVHVLDAANYVAYNLRKHLEDTFVGEKAKTGTAESIRNFTIAEMEVFLRNNIIVGDDTNEGLGYKNLTVTVENNVARIDITITPVQGIDFILATIELDNLRQTA